MKLKTKLFVLYYGWLILCPLLVLLIPIYPDNSSAAGKDRIVRVGVYENAPKVFIPEPGKPAGIFIDIIEHIAKSEGWTLRYVPGTWGEGLDRLSKGEIDLMPDVAYSLEREKVFSFHKEPVLSDWFQVYASKDKQIRSIVDLDGKRIVVLERSVQQEAFRQLAENFRFKITLISLPDYKQAFEVVARGEADAAITNRFYGLVHAHKMGLEETAVIFHPTQLFFAAPRGAPDELLKTIDKHLLELKNDSQSLYYESLKRWTTEKTVFKLPAWMKTLALIAGLALLISLVAGVLLKVQVNARTLELRQINQEMEQRIKLRTAELANAMEKAQDADRIKSAFLATMSHELRTPLNSIIGFTGIILQGIVGPLNDEQKKQLNMVRGSAQHLLSLINDVLDLSKIEAGQLQIAYENFDLRSMMEKAVESARPLTGKKGLELTYAVSPEIETINSDRRRVEQILLNLISNAVKFTEKGSVKIECKPEADNVTIRVVDTGIGIKTEDLETLFRAFRQIDSGMTRKYEGTGLGLSISKRLVELMGGQIRVTSEWGAGSTFSFSLPKERKEP
ncbi:MAG: ATP-binding protein [Deltaproteobacteria bacterium]|nr:ATP-binding protein [Deltaproteobacteria bacterium]